MADSVSRRELVQLVVAGTGTAIIGLAPSAASGDDADTEKKSAHHDPVELKMTLLLARYPSEHLTDEQIAEIRRDVHRRHVQSGILRQYTLNHTDSPGLVFAAYRGAD